MRREEKDIKIDDLSQRIAKTKHFYLTDISDLNAEQTSVLRRKCFEKEIQLLVVKNTLLRKALEKLNQDYSPLFDVLNNSTSIMFSESSSTPAKLIIELRRLLDKPILKAAWVEESIYIGDNQLDTLSSIKSKEELIADVLLVLQSPLKNLLSAISSPGRQMAGVLKTLSEKENQ
jgi:large subunit ribosomal protein L10